MLCVLRVMVDGAIALYRSTPDKPPTYSYVAPLSSYALAAGIPTANTTPVDRTRFA